MSLSTQTFGLKRFWVISALKEIPMKTDIFSTRQLNYARKRFLAGSNQILSIQSWLMTAGIIETKRKCVSLTDFGRLIYLKDPKVEMAWTWWMIHINLCSNPYSFPYSTFFTTYDINNIAWLKNDDIVQNLTKKINEDNKDIQERSIKTYFAGINMAFKQGYPLFDLQLIQRRFDNDRQERLRRNDVDTDDIVVLYAILSFINSYFKGSSTLEVRSIIEKGVAKSLGITNVILRYSLSRITQDKRLSKFISYSKTANLDSISVKNRNMGAIQKEGYILGVVEWK